MTASDKALLVYAAELAERRNWNLFRLRDVVFIGGLEGPSTYMVHSAKPGKLWATRFGRVKQGSLIPDLASKQVTIRLDYDDVHEDSLALLELEGVPEPDDP